MSLLTFLVNNNKQTKDVLWPLEIHPNTLFLLHVLKDLRGLLFYMLCAVFRWIFLKIFVMILLTFSDS